MSNGLDPDQDGRSISPDLCPNCLQRLSTRLNIKLWRLAGKEFNQINVNHMYYFANLLL